MTYDLKFRPEALAEWRKLDNSIRSQFKKKLESVVENPVRPAAALYDMKDCYKIKQRTSGYRLVYQVDQGEVVVLVLSVGKRERSGVYRSAKDRL